MNPPLSPEEIKNLAQDLVLKPYGEQFITALVGRKPGNFLRALNSLDYTQVKKVLEKAPQYSNMESGGWHALHYACATNNTEIIGLFISNAIEQGMTHFPTTSKEKNGIPANCTIVNFCAKLDAHKALAIILLRTSGVENYDYASALQHTVQSNSPRVASMVSTILGYEQTQEAAMNLFKSSYHYYDFWVFFRDCLKMDVNKISKFPIDIRFNAEQGMDYFSIALRSLQCCDRDDEFPPEALVDFARFFLEKGFDLDKVDEKGQNPRQLIMNFSQNYYYTSNQKILESKMPELEKLSMENILVKKPTTQRRLKI